MAVSSLETKVATEARVVMAMALRTATMADKAAMVTRATTAHLLREAA